jgi:FkbM family methyltransferase
VILSKPVTPQDFFRNEKPVWYYTPYSQIATPWQPITEKFMGATVEHEFMRRLPIMVPRTLYPRLREFCHRKHGQIISDYVRIQPLRAFSEFNAMGAFAYSHQHDLIEWVEATGDNLPEPVARQFHSWGGLTPQVKAEIENILSGGLSEPKRVQSKGDLHINRNADTWNDGDNSGVIPPAQQIKELSNGLWVIREDTHVSKWVEREGRLDHDQNTLPAILPLINKGDTVIDIGAFIGDHTVAYVRAAGIHGVVHAFEPNPVAFACLTHNISEAVFYNMALGDMHGRSPLSGNNGNAAGAYLGEHMRIAYVEMRPLDDFKLEPDFIKIDAEGCEWRILNGAANTIDKHQPIIVMEVNEVALGRQGVTRAHLFDFLQQHGYYWTILQENAAEDHIMYDIVARPLKTPEPQPETVPVQVAPTLLEQVKEHVHWLKEMCNSSPRTKAIVMQQLVVNKLKEPNPKNKKKNDHRTAKSTHKTKEAF